MCNVGRCKISSEEAERDLAMREPAATRSHYKNLIGDLRAARVGTLNINVSSRAVVSSRPNTLGDSSKHGGSTTNN